MVIARQWRSGRFKIAEMLRLAVSSGDGNAVCFTAIERDACSVPIFRRRQ